MINCSICLCKINKKQNIFILSCNHKLHYSCFLKYSFQNDHIFINCPLCREMNTNILSLNKNPEYHLRELLLHTNKKRCCAINNINGKRCKKNASLMNYGYCNIHHSISGILPKEKYILMNKYIHYILMTGCKFYSKIHFIDLTKKLLIKYPEINTLEDILSYGFRYKYHISKTFQDDEIINRDEIYNYYNLIKPPSLWIKKCIHENNKK